MVGYWADAKAVNLVADLVDKLVQTLAEQMVETRAECWDVSLVEQMVV